MESSSMQIRPAYDYVHLEVGGQYFLTSKQTLSKYPKSVMAKLLDAKYDHRNHPGDMITIGRDPKYFQWILDYLRGSPRPWPTKNEQLKDLLVELDFYNLTDIHSIGESIIAQNIKASGDYETIGVLSSEEEIINFITANKGLIFIFEWNTFKSLYVSDNYVLNTVYDTAELRQLGSLNCRIFVAITDSTKTLKLSRVKLNCFYNRQEPREFRHINGMPGFGISEVWINMALELAAEYTRLKHVKDTYLPLSETTILQTEASTDQLILNVGGTMFLVSKQKINVGGSLMQQLLQNHDIDRQNTEDSSPDSANNSSIFIDRNPKWFAWIINHLYDDEHKNWPDDEIDWMELLQDLDYYKLNQLKRKCEKAKNGKRLPDDDTIVHEFKPHEILFIFGPASRSGAEGVISQIVQSSEYPVIQGGIDLLDDDCIKMLIRYKLFKFIITGPTGFSICYPYGSVTEEKPQYNNTVGLWRNVALAVNEMLSKLNC